MSAMPPVIVLRDLFDGEALEAAAASGLGEFVQLWPGVEFLPIYGIAPSGLPLKPTGPSAAFIRYAPGASVPAHRHPGFEHIIVLSGSQRDHRGTYTRGACLVSTPGSSHSVASDDGCLVLAIWTKSVEVIDEEARR